MMRTSRHSQQGLTLVELMIALTLGLIVIAVVVGVFFTSNQSNRQNEAIAALQDNARFALDALSRDVAMAGYWGGVRPVDALVNLKVSALAKAATVGCGSSSGTDSLPFAVEVPIHFVNQTVTSLPDCLNSADIQPNTDVVVIRHVSGVAAYSNDGINPATGTGLVAQRFYVKTNQNFGSLFRATTNQLLANVDASGPPDCPDATGINQNCKPATTPVQIYAYTPQIYYVRKWLRSATEVPQIPVLCRRYLDDTVPAPQMREDCLAEGVENLQIEWGLGSKTVERYSSTPTDDELYSARVARITVLVRSTAANVQASSDQKTFTLGDLPSYVPTPAGVLRRSFTTTVQLKNFQP